MKQADLIGVADAYPEGFVYQANFLGADEEAELLQVIQTLPLAEAQYREWQARRRIVSYGGRYDFTHRELNEAPPVPEFLHPLRDRLADWAAVPVRTIHHAVIAEYRPGTQLGWHRDVPDFERIMGISLAGRARMRLRPYPPKPGARAATVIELAPRSAYSFSGPARWGWQHAISPTKELRYSITFRTLRNAGRDA
jgi:alkylated DNA repair dioxygenase AlkB